MMPLSQFDVPVIDISPYVDGGSAERRRAVAADLDYACSAVGFMSVTGHGIPDDVLVGLRSAIDGFFALDAGEKSMYIMPPDVNRGYTAPKSESLSLSLGVESSTRMNDFFEAFNVGTGDGVANVWPEVEGFKKAVNRYFEHAARVARTLTRIFADALGLAPDFFDRITTDSLDTFRMNNYALPPGEIELDGELDGMGEHTDYGLVTVLWADQVAGLQVVGSDLRWHDVSPADNALLVNLGDLTARLTNDRWMSTLHRVRPPIVDGNIVRRRSAAFFHDGDLSATVAPVPSCIEPGEEIRYQPVTVADHIAVKLAGSRGGKSNESATREAARARAAVPAIS
ncbi:2-oxoglutarate and iron-dependent oxygenase domain-containing protein [Rhodococcus sp. G-MC3]|uniref:isopenicillin N synthase family dioxygenase n=1 Tax=Rhodococcus sp. G-MC3 TaxID=3046209 RepID=UPI0024B93AED|nr:2-oxoglutarate and iron-dependent oxygenase domain-containing protein [Rhodococcus sp. G-MC3]MDJ0393842.1 2-oxoglutarate and iron-dependent oxygenase domain-containing protein [Rhodococcus sp. G-MC3]